ncbi:hypothetical protein PV326_013835, partial [Microctonus aethiopoides]
MVAQPTQHVHTNNNQGHPDLPSRQIYQHPNIDNIKSVRDETPLTIMTDSLQEYNNRYLYDQTPSPSIINAHINLDQQTPDNMRAFHNLQTRKSENRAITREEFRKKFQELGYLRETMKAHLIFIGGQTLREALNSFFRVPMTNFLAERFTWTGKATTNEALRKNPRLGRISRNDFITNVKEVSRSHKQTARNVRNIKNKKSNQTIRENEQDLFPDENDHDDDDL